jgi:hypothetical protein
LKKLGLLDPSHTQGWTKKDIEEGVREIDMDRFIVGNKSSKGNNTSIII